jgi:ABC-type Na+ efflux pump permease subunit
MQARAVYEVFWKEARSLCRDRSVLLLTFIVPAVLYPGLIVGVIEATIFIRSIADRQMCRIAIEGDESGDFRALVERDSWTVASGGSGLTIVSPPDIHDASSESSPADRARRWLERRGSRGPYVDAVVVFEPALAASSDAPLRPIESASESASGSDEGTSTSTGAAPAGIDVAAPAAPSGNVLARVYFASVLDASQLAKERVEDLLEAWRSTRLENEARRVGVLDLDPILDPVSVEWKSLASNKDLSRYLAGLILPLLFTIVIAMGAFYPALETTVGEKERGTLETTLVLPISRVAIVLGKYLAVSVSALLSFILNFIGMVFTFLHLQSQLPQLRGGGFELSTTAVVFVLAGALFIAAFLSALMMLAAFLARTYKEGQSYLTPIYMLSVLPVIVLINPELSLSNGLALVPLVNCSLLFRDALAGQVAAIPFAIVLVSSSFYALLALLAAASVLQREAMSSSGASFAARLFGFTKSRRESGGDRR